MAWVDDPTAFFQVELYTGDSGTNARTFDSDTDMQPDLVWIKSRSGGYRHELYDSVRGVHNRLTTGGTDANASEGTDSNGLTAFGSDGFTIGSRDQVNQGGASVKTYKAWCWKAGTTSGIVTTGADTTPTTYSFNQAAGFSIIQYDGSGSDDTQIAHGLGAIPSVIIIKNMDADDDGGVSWAMYHHANTSAPNTDYLVLDETYATADSATRWSDESPTSVLFTCGNSSMVNSSSRDFVGYLWAEKQGYSKFGKYRGSASSKKAGTFIYTGFRPAWFMCKCTSSTNTYTSWTIVDGKSSPHNVMDGQQSYANRDAVEGVRGNGSGDGSATPSFDFLSNGVKIRDNVDEANIAQNFIYMAFAEAPLVNSNGVPNNAR